MSSLEADVLELPSESRAYSDKRGEKVDPPLTGSFLERRRCSIRDIVVLFLEYTIYRNNKICHLTYILFQFFSFNKLFICLCICFHNFYQFLKIKKKKGNLTLNLISNLIFLPQIMACWVRKHGSFSDDKAGRSVTFGAPPLLLSWIVRTCFG